MCVCRRSSRTAGSCTSPHRRGLTDDQICVSGAGGVMGVAFHPRFIDPEAFAGTTHRQRAVIDPVARAHGFGADFAVWARSSPSALGGYIFDFTAALVARGFDDQTVLASWVATSAHRVTSSAEGASFADDHRLRRRGGGRGTAALPHRHPARRHRRRHCDGPRGRGRAGEPRADQLRVSSACYQPSAAAVVVASAVALLVQVALGRVLAIVVARVAQE